MSREGGREEDTSTAGLDCQCIMTLGNFESIQGPERLDELVKDPS